MRRGVRSPHGGGALGAPADGGCLRVCLLVGPEGARRARWCRVLRGVRGRRGAWRDPVRVVRLAAHGRAYRGLSELIPIVDRGLRRHRRAALRTSGPTTVAWTTTVAWPTTVALLLPTLLTTIALRASLLTTVQPWRKVPAATTARAGRAKLRVCLPTPDTDLPAGSLQLEPCRRAKVLRRQLRPDGAREKALHLEEPKHCERRGGWGGWGGWKEWRWEQWWTQFWEWSNDSGSFASF